MKNSRKKLILFCFSLVLLLGLTTLAVFAAGETYDSDANAAAAGYAVRVGEEGGNGYYTSLQDAVDDAAEGGTITVFGNVSAGAKTITAAKSLTLTGTGTISGSASPVLLVNAGTLTLDGTLTVSSSATATKSFVVAAAGATIDMKGGTITASSSATGGISFSGGTFLMSGGTIDVQNSGIFVPSPMTVRISGGKIHTASNPAIHQDYSSAAAGAQFFISGTAELLSTKHNCIHVTSVAPSSPHEIEISENAKVQSDKYAAVAMQGGTIANLTVKGGTIIGQTTDANGRGSIYCDNTGATPATVNLIIEGGNIGGKYGIDARNANVNMTMSGGTIQPSSAPIYFYGSCPSFTANISGGNLYAGSVDFDIIYGREVGETVLGTPKALTLNIAGGVFGNGTNANVLRLLAADALNVTVSGGTFTAGAGFSSLVVGGTAVSARVTIYGGTFTGGTSGITVLNSRANLRFYGGTISCAGTAIDLTAASANTTVGIDDSVQIPSGITLAPILFSTTSPTGLLIAQMPGSLRLTVLDTGEQTLYTLSGTNYYDTMEHAMDRAAAYIGKPGTPNVMYFEYLNDAVDAAKDGATIVIRSDNVINRQIVIEKDLTIIGSGSGTVSISASFEDAPLIVVRGTVRVDFLGKISYDAPRTVLYIGTGNPNVTIGDNVEMKTTGDGSAATYTIYMEDLSGRPTLNVNGQAKLSNQYTDTTQNWSVIYSNCAAVRLSIIGGASNKLAGIIGGSNGLCSAIEVYGGNAQIEINFCNVQNFKTMVHLGNTGSSTLNLMSQYVRTTNIRNGIVADGGAVSTAITTTQFSLTATVGSVISADSETVTLTTDRGTLKSSANGADAISVTNCKNFTLNIIGATTIQSDKGNAIVVSADHATVEMAAGTVKAVNGIAMYLDAVADVNVVSGTIAANTAATAYLFYVGKAGSTFTFGDADNNKKPTFTTNSTGKLAQLADYGLDVTFTINVSILNVDGFFSAESAGFERNYYKTQALADAVEFAASINGQEYTSLADAILAARDGDTIVVLKAVSSTKDPLVLNGKNITLTGEVTISNTGTSAAAIQILGNATVTIGGNLAVTGAYDGIQVSDNSTLILRGNASVTVTGNKGRYAIVLGDTGSYPSLHVLENAAIRYDSTATGSSLRAVIYTENVQNATIDLAGGTLTCTQALPVGVLANGNVLYLSVAGATVNTVNTAFQLNATQELYVQVGKDAVITAPVLFVNAATPAVADVTLRNATLTANAGAIINLVAAKLTVRAENCTLTANAGAIIGGSKNATLEVTAVDNTIHAAYFVNLTTVYHIAAATITLRGGTVVTTDAAVVSGHDKLYLNLIETTLTAPTVLTANGLMHAGVLLDGVTVTVTAANGYAIVFDNAASNIVEIRGNTLVTAANGIRAAKPITVTALGGTIVATNGSALLLTAGAEGSLLTFTNSTLRARVSALKINAANTTVSINGGNYNAATDSSLALDGENILCNINGGHFISQAANGAVLRIGAGGTMQITGSFTCAGADSVLTSPVAGQSIFYAAGQNVYAQNAILANVGASITTTGLTNTLRFGVTVNAAQLQPYRDAADDGEATVNIAVLPTAALDAMEVLTVDGINTVAAGYTVQKTSRENSDGSTTYFAKLVDLDDADVTREFSVVCWITTTISDVETADFCFYTAELHSRSIASVAAAALADSDAVWTAAQRAVLEEYAAQLP